MNEENKKPKTTRKKESEAIKDTTKKSTTTRKKTPSTEAKTTAKKSVSTAKKKTTSKAKTPSASTTTKKKSTTTAAGKKTSRTPIKKNPSVKKTASKPKPLETTILEEEKTKEIKKTVEEPVAENLSSKENTFYKHDFPTNYMIAILIVIWIFMIVFFGYQLYKNHQIKLYQQGYFYHENVNIKKVQIGELTTLLSNNSNEDAFVLFNYRGQEETYKLEKDIYELLKANHLENNFYYVDMTDVVGQKDCSLSCLINGELNTEEFKNTPAVAYFKNGQLIDIAQREDQKVLEAADFAKILDIYEFRK